MAKVIFAVVAVLVFLMLWVLCIFSTQQQEEVERDYQRLREEVKVGHEESTASADVSGV